MKSPSFREAMLTFLHEQRLILIFALLLGAFVAGHGQALASSVPASVSIAHMPNSCPATYTHDDGAWEQNNVGWGASAIIGGYQPGMWCNDDSMWAMITNPNYGQNNA